jgi:hypothetical protein
MTYTYMFWHIVIIMPPKLYIIRHIHTHVRAYEYEQTTGVHWHESFRIHNAQDEKKDVIHASYGDF